MGRRDWECALTGPGTDAALLTRDAMLQRQRYLSMCGRRACGAAPAGDMERASEAFGQSSELNGASEAELVRSYRTFRRAANAGHARVVRKGAADAHGSSRDAARLCSRGQKGRRPPGGCRQAGGACRRECGRCRARRAVDAVPGTLRGRPGRASRHEHGRKGHHGERPDDPDDPQRKVPQLACAPAKAARVGAVGVLFSLTGVSGGGRASEAPKSGPAGTGRAWERSG